MFQTLLLLFLLYLWAIIAKNDGIVDSNLGSDSWKKKYVEKFRKRNNTVSNATIAILSQQYVTLRSIANDFDNYIKENIGDIKVFRNNLYIYKSDRVAYMEKRDKKLKNNNSKSTVSILYVKTHKTGSSTVTGILWRQLCVRNHLNCFLPSPNNPGKTWELTNRRDLLYIRKGLGTAVKGGPYDAWVHHVKYSALLHEYAVKSPHMFISSVRHPSSRFQSAWKYFNLTGSFNMSFHRMVEKMRAAGEEQVVPWNKRFRGVYNSYIGLDATSHELTGSFVLSTSFFMRFTKITLRDVLSYKLFLIVCDRFDESLLILRWIMRLHSGRNIFFSATDSPRLVGNSLDTVSGDSVDSDLHDDRELWYLPQKVSSRPTQNSTAKLSAEDKAFLSALQPYDTLLYRVANAVLDQLIGFYGKEEFQRTLQRYRTNLRAVQHACDADSTSTPHHDFHQALPIHNATLRLTPQDCHLMRMDNEEFINVFWKKLHNGTYSSELSDEGLSLELSDDKLRLLEAMKKVHQHSPRRASNSSRAAATTTAAAKEESSPVRVMLSTGTTSGLRQSQRRTQLPATLAQNAIDELESKIIPKKKRKKLSKSPSRLP